MNSVPNIPPRNQGKNKLLEVIGPAGAGKTSLCKALSVFQDQIKIRKYPLVKGKEAVAFYGRYGLPMIPRIISLSFTESRNLNRREIAWMAILNGWSDVLKKDLENNSHNIVLDQGPVYLLVEMSELGPEHIRTDKAEHLWDSLYSRWAKSLDWIVSLDASDEVLMERIRTRQKGHVVKEESDSTIIEFLQQYRKAFEDVVSRLKVNGNGPRVLSFDTGKQKPEEIATTLMAELGQS